MADERRPYEKRLPLSRRVDASSDRQASTRRTRTSYAGGCDASAIPPSSAGGERWHVRDRRAGLPGALAGVASHDELSTTITSRVSYDCCARWRRDGSEARAGIPRWYDDRGARCPFRVRSGRRKASRTIVPFGEAISANSAMIGEHFTLADRRSNVALLLPAFEMWVGGSNPPGRMEVPVNRHDSGIRLCRGRPDRQSERIAYLRSRLSSRPWSQSRQGAARL